MAAAPAPALALPTRYPGAQPFTDSDLARKLFSGREQEAVALTHQILANRLVVLFARSGLGKTSLLNAGVLQNLRSKDLLPLMIRLNDCEHGALASLYACVRTDCVLAGIEYVPGDSRSLWHFFKTAEFWKDDILLEPVLILDQFEELFTLQSPERRSAFVDELSYLARGVRPDPKTVQSDASGAALSDVPPRIKIVVSMREDFLANVEELSDRIPEILDNRFRLLPLSRPAAASAIERPSAVEDAALATAPFRVRDDAKEVILDFLQRRVSAVRSTASAQIEPFQLQLICQHLEELARLLPATPALRVLSAEDIGGEPRLRRIIKDFYRRQTQAVPLLQRHRVRSLCSESLISPGGRRLRMEESEIKRLTGVDTETLQLLVDRRLLRAEPSDSGTYYELSHDSLIAPVLESRRVWFVARSVALIVMLLVGFVVFLIFMGGTVVAMVAAKLSWGHLFLVPFAIFLAWGGTAWLRRKFRKIGEMWRRSHG